jgi:hypothetical protein
LLRARVVKKRIRDHVVLITKLVTYLEETVVASGVELGRLLDVIVEGPEVLNCAEGDDRSLILFPTSVAIVLEKPKGPFVLKKDETVIQKGFS